MTPGKGSGITNENTLGQGLPLYFSGTGRGHVSIDLSAILAACQHKSKDLHVKFAVGDRWEIFGELVEPAVARLPDDSSGTSKFSLNCRFSTEDLSALNGPTGDNQQPAEVLKEPKGSALSQLDNAELEQRCLEDDHLCKQLEEEVAKSDKVRSRCWYAASLVLLLGYYGFGVTYYMNVEDWGAVDAVYFITVTLTTVGYGDLLPTTDQSKMVTCGFIVVGLCIMGTCLSTLTDGVIGTILMLDDEDASDDCSLCGANPVYRTIAIALLVFFFCVAGGMAFFANYVDEDLSFLNSMYLCFVTVSTVGYGDYSPQSEGGRIFSVGWILFSVVFLAKAVGSVFEVQARYKHQQLRARMLKKRITLRDLRAFDSDLDGKLDQNEFVLCKMSTMGLFSEADLGLCLQSFKEMDIDSSGNVDMHDIIRHGNFGTKGVYKGHTGVLGMGFN